MKSLAQPAFLDWRDWRGRPRSGAHAALKRPAAGLDRSKTEGGQGKGSSFAGVNREETGCAMLGGTFFPNLCTPDRGQGSCRRFQRRFVTEFETQGRDCPILTCDLPDQRIDLKPAFEFEAITMFAE